MGSTVSLSVVLAAHNAERFLDEAIRSVLVQTFGDFEFLVVDDGSSDGTLAIARRYERLDARVRVLTHENVGLGQSLNDAISQARGDWIARMDADDRMLPKRLERQLAFATQHPEAAVIASRVYYIDESGRRLGASKSEFTTLAATRAAVEGNRVIHFQHPSVMMRRVAFEAVGGYRPQFWPADDIDLWNRMAERGFGVVVQPEVLLDYRVHGGSVTVSSAHLVVWKAEWAEECMRRRRAGVPEPAWDEYVAEEKRSGTLRRLYRVRGRRGRGYYKLSTYCFAQRRYLAFTGKVLLGILLAPEFVVPRVRDRWIHSRSIRARGSQSPTRETRERTVGVERRSE